MGRKKPLLILLIMQTQNKKIKNATAKTYNGINFRSSLEVRLYKYLLSKNIDTEYEPETIIIWEGKHFSVPFYSTIGRNFKKITTKTRAIHYTPDFIIYYNGYKIYLEAKGFTNDVFPYKAKLFRSWLETQPKELKLCFAVVHSIKELEFVLKDLSA